MNDPEVGWNVFGEPVARTVEEESEWLRREVGRSDARFFEIHRREGDAWEPSAWPA